MKLTFTTLLTAILLSASTAVAIPSIDPATSAIGFDLSRQNHFGAPKRPGQPGAKPGWYFGRHPERHPKLPCLSGPICRVLSRYPKGLQCPRPPPVGSTTTTTTTATTTTTETVTATVTDSVTVTTTDSASTTPTPASSSSSSSSTSPTSSASSSGPVGPGTGNEGGYTPTFLNEIGATEAGDYLTFGLVDTVDDCKAMCNSVQGCGFINTYNDINGKDHSPQLTCALFTKCHTVRESTNVGGQSQIGDGTINKVIRSDGYCKNA
ncbi:hypothetical protein DFP72DRAFT_839727 [Ephemerocybe angulata]|uniref:Apple domain-containing protein n=1 Tax=Ephemerocybe angulata TaxID=980116 RepID=A0A8H6IGQ4_9AGAR|nr:hypothetical protein DFP72DRAFT_839727 [Tulosesus angulatus]